MGILKSHKTIEQIAKKHGVSVSYIKNQLKLGIPIEHEHTNDEDVSTDIALQHLGEFPDYYTKLKKMEADEKKSVKEHCGCEDKAVEDLESGLKKLNNTSYSSIDKLMRRIMKKYDMTAKQLHNSFVDIHNKTPDDWIKDLDEETKSGDQGLHDWFNKSKSSDGTKGWVQLGGKWAGKPCARQPGQTSTPKCGSSKMARNLSAKEEESARKRKNRQDPNQPEKTGSAKPTYVRTEEMNLQEVKDKPGKGSGKKDACYHKVKSRYSVWPSAYGSASLVKCRKVGAANWGVKEDYEDDYSADISDWDAPVHIKTEPRYCPKCKKEEQRHECKYGPKCWDIYSMPVKLKNTYTTEDHEYSMARSEISKIMSAAKRLKKKLAKGEGDIEAWVQSKITKAADYIDTAADYVDSGEHKVDENISFDVTHTSADVKKAQRAKKIANLAQKGVGGEKSTAARMSGVSLPSIKKEETLVDKLTKEVLDEKCWTGYKKKGMKTMFGKKYPNCVKTEESITIEDADGNTFAEVVDIIKPEPIKGFKSQIDEVTRLQSQTGNIMAITLTWRGKYYSLKMFFPQVKLPTRKEINQELQKVYPGSKVLATSVSEFSPGQPLIQPGINGGSLAHPGPNLKYVKPCGEQVEFYEDWQKVNRQDKTDGLSQKAVDAYRREHPGSKLKTAVTEKKPTGKRAKRRESFCRRMSGMRAKLTSAKTARDPDSRINKALRRWRCR